MDSFEGLKFGKSDHRATNGARPGLRPSCQWDLLGEDPAFDCKSDLTLLQQRRGTPRICSNHQGEAQGPIQEGGSRPPVSELFLTLHPDSRPDTSSLSGSKQDDCAPQRGKKKGERKSAGSSSVGSDQDVRAGQPMGERPRYAGTLHEGRVCVNWAAVREARPWQADRALPSLSRPRKAWGKACSCRFAPPFFSPCHHLG